VSKTWPAERVAEAHACGQRAFGENQVQEGVEKITQLTNLALEWHVHSGRHEISRTHADVPGPSSGVASPQGGASEGGRGALGDLTPETPVGSEFARRTDDRLHGRIPQAGPCSTLHRSLLLPLEWHFIGPVQSNKTRPISEHFQWVHGVEREKVAVRLNDARPAHLPPLDVCIQVNVSGEGSKSGVEPGQEAELARIVAGLPRLRLRGLMAIPEPTADRKLQRRRFALLRDAKDRLVAAGYALDTLSMGMSDDLEAAILEGATMVRVGTAIFGKRREK